MTRAVAGRDTRLCARGLHADVPENEYRAPGDGRRRCRPCKVEYMRERRQADSVGPLTPDVLRRLRAMVGATAP